MKIIHIFVICNCLFIGTAIIALAQPGSIDTTFSSDGKVTTEIGSSTDIGNSVAIQSDGKIVVAGNSYNGSFYDFALVRYNSDGSLDTTFDSDGKVTTNIGSSHEYGYSIAIQSDGKIVVAGAFWKVSYYDYDFALVRYNSDGSLDSTFDYDGKVTTVITINEDDYGYSVAIQSDGKIVVAGYSYNGVNNDFALVRYNSNGSLDNTFDSDGKVTTAIGSAADYGRSVAIQSDGKIVAGGYSNNGSNNDFALVRYNTNGSLDNTFDSDGKVTTAVGSSDDLGYSIAIQSDGKIVVGGYSKNGSNNDFALLRYNSNGSLDNTFDSDGKVITAVGSSNDYGYSVTIQSDNKIIVAGNRINGSNYDFTLVRYNSDGSLDNTFDSDGKVTTAVGSYDDLGYSIAIQSDGKLVVAGKSSNGSDDDLALVRYNTDGSLDNAFDSDGKVTTAIGRSGDFGAAVAIQSDGKIVVAGTSNNGTINVFSLARYSSDGSLDSAFSSDGIVTTAVVSYDNFGSSVAIQSDGKIVVAGYTINYEFALTRYTTNGTLDNTFDSDGIVTTTFGNVSNSVVIQSDGKIVVAGYAWSGINDDFAVVRYNSNGSLDNTFDSDGKVTTNFGSVEGGYSVCQQADGKIVVAGTMYISSNNYDFVLARYNSNGSLDNTFDSDGKVTTAIGSSSENGNSVAIQSDGKIVVAGISMNDFVLVRYNSNGSLDNTFDSDGKVTTDIGNYDNGSSVAIQSDGKIVVVGHSYNGVNNDFAILRYNNDGTLDSTFDCDGKVTTVVKGFYDVGNSVAIQIDGKIVVAGYSSNDYNYNYDFAIVRYNGVCASITFTQSPTICQGQSINVGNNIYNASGTYIDTLTATNCCDSIVTTNLTVLPNSSFTQSLTICNGQSVIVGSQTYTLSGNFMDTLTAANGCDSIVTTLLTVADTIKITNNASICNGDSFSVGANIYTVSGTYMDPFIAFGGCDSIVTTNLTVLSNSNFTQSLTICNGQSVIVGSQTYTLGGTFMDTLTAVNGCDSIVTTLLSVADTLKIANNVSICNGDSFSVGANIYTVNGTYIDSFITLSGCDSIITTTLTVKQNSSFSQSIIISSGQSLTVGTHTYTTSDTSGTYTDTLIAAATNGCDSIVTTNLTVVTGIEAVSSGQWAISVYPNPFSNNVELRIQNAELELKNTELKIFNTVGKIIFLKTLNSKHETLNLDLPNGTYFICFTQDNKIITSDKLVITD